MGNKELRQWSSEAYEELRTLEEKRHRILKRCCRAVLNGAVEVRECEDPVLMNTYTPRLNHCPECGEPLEFDT